MNMTQQEAIKISNNLMAEKFFTCLRRGASENGNQGGDNDDDDALFRRCLNTNHFRPRLFLYFLTVLCAFLSEEALPMLRNWKSSQGERSGERLKGILVETLGIDSRTLTFLLWKLRNND
jgi:hypothetical protein